MKQTIRSLRCSVATSDENPDFLELTVFEDGRACSIVMTPGEVRCLADLLIRNLKRQSTSEALLSDRALEKGEVFEIDTEKFLASLPRELVADKP